MFNKSFYAKRLPRASTLVLNSKRLFILPSRAGVAGLFAIIAVYLLATNYQNNLILLFAYLLMSFYLVTMLASFYNLYGVKLTFLTVQPAFLGEMVKVQLGCESDKTRFQLSWQDAKGDHQITLSPGQNTLVMYWCPTQRGYFELPRFKLYSCAPFGLFTVWSYPALGERVLVYPTPIAAQQTQDRQSSLQRPQDPNSSDHFSGLKGYQKGDSMSRVLWKKALPERPWVVKEFKQAEREAVVFSYYERSGSHEVRLSQLTALVIEAAQRQQKFALILPNQRIDAAMGELHKQSCLEHLALQPRA